MNKKEIEKITAYHEAGHALICHMLGYNIKSMEIDDSGDGFVWCATFRPTAFLLDCEKLERELFDYGLKCLSGYLTEFHYQNFLVLPESLYSQYFVVQTSINDFGCLSAEIAEVNSMLGYEKYGYEFVKSIIYKIWAILDKNNNWKAVSCLTRTLIKEGGFLEGDRIHEILSQHVGFGSTEGFS